MLSDMKLSDLFFNQQHANLESLYAAAPQIPPSRDEVVAAVQADAAEFADDYPEFGKDAEWYAKDFMERV